MKNTIIECENLSFDYEQGPVLNNLNFRVNQQDYVAIIGENGAGKSTLLKLLIGELTLQKGSLTIFGQKEFNQYGKIGYVPQMSVNQEFNFPATVFEIVKYHCYPQIKKLKLKSKEVNEIALNCIKQVGLWDKRNELFSRLSGGQQQRVMLAKALVNKPELLILDEPTSGVDHKSSDQFYEMLHELNQNGLTILLVTHNVDHVSRYVNRIFILEETQLKEGHCGNI